MFEDKMKRILLAAGVKSDTDLAEILCIKPPSVAGARKRKTVPGDWVEKIAKNYSVSADWLLFGRGSMHPDDTAQIQEPHEKISPVVPDALVLCPRCARLEEKLERVEEERREVSAENRTLWKENGDLRERCAKLEGQQRQPPVVE